MHEQGSRTGFSHFMMRWVVSPRTRELQNVAEEQYLNRPRVLIAEVTKSY
jgi:hypothetical protein